MTEIPTLPINPATGAPWTQAEVDAARAAVDAANVALGGDKVEEIAADVQSDAVQALGGDANIIDPAERRSLGLPPLDVPAPPEPPAPPVDPGTPPTLGEISAHVDDLETRVSKLEAG